MSSPLDDAVDALAHLGFTEMEARIYAFLCQEAPATGYRIAERLRSTGLSTYLIALTGYGLAEDRRHAHRSGFDAHLTKPPPMDRLLALVETASA